MFHTINLGLQVYFKVTRVGDGAVIDAVLAGSIFIHGISQKTVSYLGLLSLLCWFLSQKRLYNCVNVGMVSAKMRHHVRRVGFVRQRLLARAAFCNLPSNGSLFSKIVPYRTPGCSSHIILT